MTEPTLEDLRAQAALTGRYITPDVSPGAVIIYDEHGPAGIEPDGTLVRHMFGGVVFDLTDCDRLGLTPEQARRDIPGIRIINKHRKGTAP